MKFQLFVVAALVISLALTNSPSYGQGLTASRLAVGVAVGGQKIYCDGAVGSGIGGGIDIYGKYNISPRFFTRLAIGYGELSDGTLIFGTSEFSTDLVTLDVKGGVNLLTEGNVIPYAYVGAGGFYFHYDGPNPNLKGRFLGGYGDASFMLGGGFEIRLNPNMALDFHTDYRFTTGDDLDGINQGKGNDGYLNFRTGITYYLDSSPFSGSSSSLQLSEKSPLDEISGEGFGDSPDDELNALIEGLDSYGAASDANMAMEEYVKLKSRVDQLGDAIRQKELEIEELKSQLMIRKEKISDLENNLKKRSGALASSLSADLSDFSSSYEQALQHYYSREFDAAIYMFSMLLETSPTHKLISNCQYWIGESYFGQGDFAQAVDAFQRVLAYDESFKRDDALLMMGRSYIKLGDKQTARQMFDQLMTDFPDSEYYQKARQYASGL